MEASIPYIATRSALVKAFYYRKQGYLSDKGYITLEGRTMQLMNSTSAKDIAKVSALSVFRQS